MRFQLDEEYELTRAAVKDFAEGELAGGAAERDEKEWVDRRLFAHMAAIGLTGIPIAERWGGAGSDRLAYAIVLEELARVCASTSALLHAHTMAAWVISQYGPKPLLERKLKPLTTGARLGVITCDSDHLKLRKVSGDLYRLNGSVRSVDLVGEADDYVFLIPARSGHLLLGVMDGGQDTLPTGLRIEPTFGKLGLRGIPTAEVYFEAVQCRFFYISKEEAKAADSERISNSVRDMQDIGVAAQAVGTAQGALEAALAYAKDRSQFGKPIGRQQGIAFKLADMAANVEAARWLVYEAAWSLDRGLPSSGKAAAARRFATKHAVTTAIEAVQIFGGYGYIREYRVERYLRDAKTLEALSRKAE